MRLNSIETRRGTMRRMVTKTELRRTKTTAPSDE
jgi:hypothetical protein